MIAPELSAPELGLIEHMLGEAAADAGAVLSERGEKTVESGRRTSYRGIVGASEAMQDMYSLQETRIAERTHDLAVADEAKTRFLATASHDLRQPIQDIPHHKGFIGQAANFALHVAARMKKAGVKPGA